MTKSKNVTRSFKIKGPSELIPIYNLLQDALNRILQNQSYVNQLIQISFTQINPNTGKPTKKLSGVIWDEIKSIVGNPLAKKVCDSWYMRIVYENISRLLQSRTRQIQIYNILQANSFKINQTLRDTLASNDLYVTNSELNSLSRAKTIPTLPKKSKLVMDFSVSAPQMFKVIYDEKAGHDTITYSVKVKPAREENAWVNFKLYLPISIRSEDLTKISKPNFTLNYETGELIGNCPYNFTVEKKADANILGVDLGKLKLYSATVLYQDGTYSDEYTHSVNLERRRLKLTKLNEHINKVYEKVKRSEPYTKTKNVIKQMRRDLDYKLNRSKKARLNLDIAKNIASEVVSLALRENCSHIHLENLSFVGNKGGKWNYREIQNKISEVAAIYGIEVVKVNAKGTSYLHPITGEQGKKSERLIIFEETGEVIDRDQLASLNIAARSKNMRTKPRLKIRDTDTRLRERRTLPFKKGKSRHRVLRERRDSLRAELVFKEINRAGLVTPKVMFCYRNTTRVVPVLKKQEELYKNSTTACCPKNSH